MAEEKTAELIFIPTPGAGHLISAVEMAKLLVHRDHRLSVTVFIFKMPNRSTTDFHSDSDNPRIRFVDLHISPPPAATSPDNSEVKPPNPIAALFSLIDGQKPHIRDYAARIIGSGSTRLAGFVVDMFCTSMVDVADELGVPSYVFFTSSAAFLGLMLHLHKNREEATADSELSVLSFENPVPARVLPSVFKDDKGDSFIDQVGRFREIKGILVNTFTELEPHALTSLRSSGDLPPVYPVGPVLSLSGHGGDASKSDAIMRWLDDQPPSSVVFLCFGSMGSFGGDQVREIAVALEQSGRRFLWSLRQPPPKGKMEMPAEYADLGSVLPEGFLDRTEKIGKVIGWAPQARVLSHPAVGGFVSHCGWNSTLESIWCGVPMATWPLYAEQQMNAFYLVKELGLAVEIRLDYRRDFMAEEEEEVVSAEEIESGIRRLMGDDCDMIRNKWKDIKEKSRAAVLENGSSYTSIGRLIQDFIGNVS